MRLSAMWSIAENSQRIRTRPGRALPREAGAGGSNTLTLTRLAVLDQKLTSPSGAFPEDRLFPRKPHAEIHIHFAFSGSSSPGHLARSLSSLTAHPTRARGKVPPLDRPRPLRSSRSSPSPSPAGWIARPSAGSGRSRPRPGDRVPRVSPTGGLGSHRSRGGSPAEPFPGISKQD
jgi:hypothetical protein